MTGRAPFITLDSRNFKYFTSGPDRNYSLIVHITLKGIIAPKVLRMLRNSLIRIADSSRRPVNQHIKDVFFAEIFDFELVKYFCEKVQSSLTVQTPCCTHYRTFPTRRRRYQKRSLRFKME
ncbi:hypothetical protein RF11_02323 [Thelohanellus kitauei]|uniref:Uncharacterized protein n=1 Tax=Thelohanellus kitauei TaxID=669202 RepID=A0A0C2IXD8_THEKT|nr:hypothetical protein RF11_02323 [Thelohanellus kitauei]